MRQNPDELDRTFIPAFDQADFLRTGELFVPRQSLDRVDLTVEVFLNRAVRHGCCRAGAVPVLFAGRNLDHVARTNLLNCTTPTLYPAAPGGDDDSLTERMRVPRSPCARLECHAGTGDERRLGRLERGSIRTVSVNHSGGPFAERLRSDSLDFHVLSSDVLPPS
jgi:hypothetical protein